VGLTEGIGSTVPFYCWTKYRRNPITGNEDAKSAMSSLVYSRECLATCHIKPFFERYKFCDPDHILAAIFMHLRHPISILLLILRRMEKTHIYTSLNSSPLFWSRTSAQTGPPSRERRLQMVERDWEPSEQCMFTEFGYTVYTTSLQLLDDCSD
jgi:hypothetical protein